MSDEIKNTENTGPEGMEAAPAEASERKPRERHGRDHDSAPRQGGEEGGTAGEEGAPERGKAPFQRSTRFRRKSCRFCHDKNIKIDYKSYEMLEKFITDRGKILPRRITGTCAKHQRALSREIKRARIIALLPFVLQ